MVDILPVVILSPKFLSRNALYGLWGGNAVPLIHLLILAPRYINLLVYLIFSFLVLSVLFIYFLTHLLPDLSTLSRMCMFRFQAKGRRR